MKINLTRKKRKYSDLFKVLLVLLLTGVMYPAVLKTYSYAVTRPVAPEKIIDDESVYVMLDASGKPKKTIVVDWLTLVGNGLLEVRDKGDITKAEALKDRIVPEIGDGFITWKVQANSIKNFYYRAETKKELPVEIGIEYFLDGFEVSPKEIAGKKGRVKIRFTVKNKLKRQLEIPYLAAGGESYKTRTEDVYVPLMTNINLEFKAGRFTNIDAPGAMLSVAGEKETYIWMLMPQEDEEAAEIEMDTNGFELDPIIISVMPELPDFDLPDLEEGFLEMRDGFEELSLLPEAHIEILDEIIEGLDSDELDKFSEATSSLALFKDGIMKLRGGVVDLMNLTNAHIMILDGILEGIDLEELESIGEFVKALKDLSSGVMGTKDGLDGVIQLLDGQTALLSSIRQSNAALYLLSQQTLINYPDDPDVSALVSGLAAQDLMLEALLNGGDLGQGYMPGLISTGDNLRQISAGLGQISAGLELIASESEALKEFPKGMKDLKEILTIIKKGGEIDEQELPGLDTTKRGFRAVAGALMRMKKGLDDFDGDMGEMGDLTEAFDELRDALVTLRDGGELEGYDIPGIKDEQEYFQEIIDGLDEGLEDLRAGEAVQDTMKLEAERYDTFLGKPAGAEGRVRFIMKTEEIS